MEQTFHDLFNEQKQQPGQGFFPLTIFTETAIGIVREHLLILIEGNVMKNMLANPRSAAIASLLLSLPLGLTYVAFMFDIESLAKLLNALFTIPGQQGEINTLGRIVIYGGLLIMPVAFALNLIVGIAILLLITFTWGGLMLEETYCLQGIRCD